MNVTLFLTYALAAGLVVGCGSWLLERSLWSQRFPARGAWLAALAITVWLPVGSLVTAAQDPPPQVVVALGEDVRAGGGEAEAFHGMIVDAARPGGFDFLRKWGDWSAGMLETAARVLPRMAMSAKTVGAVWAFGSLVVGLVLMTSVLRFIRRESDWPEAYVLGRRVRISPSVGPATFGLISPRIVLPRWSTELPPAELELVLQHEEEHVRSRDTALLAAGLLAAVACPWNPAVWWQARRLKGAIEVDCDRRVLRRGVAADRYGELLVRLGMRGTAASPALPTITGSISQLERRLKIMSHSRNGSPVSRAFAPTVVGVMLVVGACTTDAPVAAGVDAAPDESRLAEPAPSEVVAVWVSRGGQVQVNGAVHPVDGVSEAVEPLYTSETVVSLEAHEAAPYAVVAAVQEELRRAGLIRIVFIKADSEEAGLAPSDADVLSESGLAAVLPHMDNAMDMREVAARNPTNILFLDIQPSGTVGIRRGANPAMREVQPAEVEALWRAEVATNPSLIALVETHPEAEYRHMYGVLDALQRAEATRFSLQVAE